jgi:short-subunit dehydrogenase
MLANDCKHYITGATKDAGTAGANATTAADVRMTSICRVQYTMEKLKKRRLHSLCISP